MQVFLLNKKWSASIERITCILEIAHYTCLDIIWSLNNEKNEPVETGVIVDDVFGDFQWFLLMFGQRFSCILVGFRVKIIPHDQCLLSLTLKVIRLSIHEDVVDKDDAEDAGPQMQVTEDEQKANIL